MKTFAKKIRIRQRSSVRGSSGYGRQRVAMSVPRGSKLRIKQG